MSNLINDTFADQIERGEIYIFSDTISISEAADLPNTYSRIDYLVTTGASQSTVIFGLSSTLSMTIILYEGESFGAGTGSLSSFNMNRNIANTLLTGIEYKDTFGAPSGTIIYKETAPEGVFSDASPFNSGAGFVFKPNTQYLLEVQPTAGREVPLNVKFFVREL